MCACKLSLQFLSTFPADIRCRHLLDEHLQEALPLPASLELFRLEHEHNVVLDGVGSWHRRLWPQALSAAPEPVLIVRAASIKCSCRRSARGFADPYARQLVSHLPDRFSALHMQTPHVEVNPHTTVHEAAPAAAAHSLCSFFALAPESYRRFSVCWPAHDLPLRIHVTGRMADNPPGVKYCDLRPVAFDTADALAGHMRARAVQHNMSVTVVEEPRKGIIFTRL